MADTVSDDVYVTMLVSGGENDDIRWFEYKASFFDAITHVEWEKDTMNAILPADIADYLVRNGYAKLMTEEEIQALVAVEPVPETSEPAVKKRR